MYQTFLFTTLLPAILLVKYISAEMVQLDTNRLLRRHQQYRQATLSSNMIKAVWSPTLAKQAEDLLTTYGGDFQKMEQHMKGSSIGINVGSSSSVDSGRIRGPQDVPIGIIDLWGSQRTRFRPPMGCGNDTCKEYVRMISAGMDRMGCAMMKRADEHIMVCLYDDIGPIDDQQPYKTGRPCSECPADFPNCEQQMCAAKRGAVRPEPDIMRPRPTDRSGQSPSQFQPSPTTQPAPVQPMRTTPQVPETNENDKKMILGARDQEPDEPTTTTTSRGASSFFGFLNGFSLLIGTALLHFGYSS